MRMKKILPLLFLVSFCSFSQEIALLKYNGGGDWYANPTALPNLIKFCNSTIKTKLVAKPAVVEPNNPALLSYPFIHMTGHGNVVFSPAEIKNLRAYLSGGGFLHIDDNYGMDPYVRKQIALLFPDQKLVEIPSDHPLFQAPFPFPAGLPKIHEHDGARPQALGLFIKEKLAILYTYESDISDGWEDAEVHNNPANVREKALKMGANIIHYIFNN